MLATLFGFKGRLSRAGFIEVLLAVVLIDVAALLSAKYVQEFGQDFGLPQVAAPGGAVALAVVRIAPIVVAAFTAWTVVAAVAKRAHDRNRTGWLILLAIVPVVGWAWLVIDLFVLAGTPGRNSFGRAPFATASEDRAEHVALAAMASAQHAQGAAEAEHAAASDHGHDAPARDAQGHDAHGHDDHGHDDHAHDDHGHTAHDGHGSEHDAAADVVAHHDAHGHEAHGHDAPSHDVHAHDDHDDHGADDHHGHHVAADHHHAEPVHA